MLSVHVYNLHHALARQRDVFITDYGTPDRFKLIQQAVAKSTLRPGTVPTSQSRGTPRTKRQVMDVWNTPARRLPAASQSARGAGAGGGGTEAGNRGARGVAKAINTSTSRETRMPRLTAV